MKYYRIIRFRNRSQTAEMLPSLKLPGTEKLMLFTTEKKAREFIEAAGWRNGLFGTFPDMFMGKITKRYVIDPVISKVSI